MYRYVQLHLKLKRLISDYLQTQAWDLEGPVAATLQRCHHLVCMYAYSCIQYGPKRFNITDADV